LSPCTTRSPRFTLVSLFKAPPAFAHRLKAEILVAAHITLHPFGGAGFYAAEHGMASRVAR
jgi:hypothetical protein